MTDRIDKEILVHAAPVQLWSRLTDPEALGRWFHVRFEQGPTPGAHLRAAVVYAGFEGAQWEGTSSAWSPSAAWSGAGTPTPPTATSTTARSP